MDSKIKFLGWGYEFGVRTLIIFWKLAGRVTMKKRNKK